MNYQSQLVKFALIRTDKQKVYNYQMMDPDFVRWLNSLNIMKDHKLKWVEVRQLALVEITTALTVDEKAG